MTHAPILRIGGEEYVPLDVLARTIADHDRQPLTIALPADLTVDETVRVLLAVMREQERIRRARDDEENER